ncbi:MAG TPA: pilin [Candidatus Paceibacterota bacterium]
MRATLIIILFLFLTVFVPVYVAAQTGPFGPPAPGGGNIPSGGDIRSGGTIYGGGNIPAGGDVQNAGGEMGNTEKEIPNTGGNAPIQGGVFTLPGVENINTGAGAPRQQTGAWQGIKEGLIPCGFEGKPKCDFNQLMILANNIITFLVTLSFPVAAVAFAYAGFLIMTAGGDTGKVERGKEIFKNVGIGFIIILAAFLVVSVIMKTFVKSSEFVNLLQR